MKFLVTTGALITALAPVAAVISCGESSSQAQAGNSNPGNVTPPQTTNLGNSNPVTQTQSVVQTPVSTSYKSDDFIWNELIGATKNPESPQQPLDNLYYNGFNRISKDVFKELESAYDKGLLWRSAKNSFSMTLARHPQNRLWANGYHVQTNKSLNQSFNYDDINERYDKMTNSFDDIRNGWTVYYLDSHFSNRKYPETLQYFSSRTHLDKRLLTLAEANLQSTYYYGQNSEWNGGGSFIDEDPTSFDHIGVHDGLALYVSPDGTIARIREIESLKGDGSAGEYLFKNIQINDFNRFNHGTSWSTNLPNDLVFDESYADNSKATANGINVGEGKLINIVRKTI